MPRAMRVEYPGAIDHVMDRGDRREDIFVDDVDRQDWLKTLAEAWRKTDWPVPADCLMRNHFHLVLETPHANLVEGMRWFLSAYTIRLNHRQKLFGHVFSGRYKALIVEGSGNGYLKTACDDVHLGLQHTQAQRPRQAGHRRPVEERTPLPIKWIAARVQIGTAKGAKTVLHHLAQGQHPRQTSSATKQCAQLEFQSTV